VSALISTRISDSILFMLAAPIAVDIAIHHPYLSPHWTTTSVTGFTAARTTGIAAFGNVTGFTDARTTGIAAFGNDIGRLYYISTFTPIYPYACACGYRLWCSRGINYTCSTTNVKIFPFLSV
jgi:hypothetical protein